MDIKYTFLISYIIVMFVYGSGDRPYQKNDIVSLRQDEFLLDTSVTTIPGYGSQITPVVASDGTDFLLVWTEFRNQKLQIFGARMDQNGVLLDTLAIPIATKAETQYAPAVVFGGSYYFVVWEEYHEVFSLVDYVYPHRIYGTRINAAGVVVDTNAILISNIDVYYNLNPDVAFDGTNYFVVWLGQGVQGARVSQSGVVLDNPFTIACGSHPCVAFTGTYYLVAWDNCYGYYANGMISCSRVSTNGVVIDTNAIIVSQGTRAKKFPEIAGDDQDFFIVWEDLRHIYNDSLAIEIYGARVSQTGTVLDTAGINISRYVLGQRTPAIAFDGTNYLVVWEDRRKGWLYDIYCSRISSNGVIIDRAGLAITKDTFNNHNYDCYPEVAFGNDHYLVTWQLGGHGKPVQYDIYAARIMPSGVVIDTSGVAVQTQVPGHQYSSTSAFDGTNYLIVWNDYHYGDTSNIYCRQSDCSDVIGCRVDGTGAVLDTETIKVTSAALDQVNPCIEFDGVNYFVVWEDDSAFDFNCVVGRIKGKRIEPNGRVIDTTGILITGSGHALPAISFDGSNYLVVYHGWANELCFRRVAPTGVVIDPVDIVIASDQQYLIAGGAPGIAFDGTNYLVVWASGQYWNSLNIYGARISPAGAVIDTVPIVIANAGDIQFRPAIAFDGTNNLVIWEDQRNASVPTFYSDIYGARVSPAGTVLDPQGIPISTAFGDQECPDVGFDGTNYVVVWQDLRDTTSYSIYGAKVSPAGNVLNTYKVVTDPYDQIEPAITRGNGDQMLITYTGWTSMINSHRAHTMRIWGRMYPFPGVEEGSGMPSSSRMLSLNAYPNPCRDRIEIKWVVPKAGGSFRSSNDRRLVVYDVTGSVVKDLSRLLAPDINLNQTTWDMTDDAGRRLPAGVYFVRLEIPGKELVEKIVLVK